MGCRLHVQKKHVIEYADGMWFNWAIPAANEFLIQLCSDVTEGEPWSDNEDFPQNGRSFEYLKDNWKLMIAEMEKRASDDVAFVSDGENYTNGEMLNAMKEILESCDPEQDYIFLDWF